VVLAVVCQAASEDEKRSLVSVHADADSNPLVGRQRAKELLDDDRGPGDLIHDDCGICFQVAAASGIEEKSAPVNCGRSSLSTRSMRSA